MFLPEFLFLQNYSKMDTEYLSLLASVSAAADAFLLLDDEKRKRDRIRRRKQFEKSKPKSAAADPNEIIIGEHSHKFVGSFSNQTILLKNTAVYNADIIQIRECTFRKLLSYIYCDIRKVDTVMKVSVPAEDRLALILRYLGSDNSCKSISKEGNMSKSFASQAITDVCKAIYEKMGPIYLKIPESKEKWKELSKNIYEKWNFPLCLGILHGAEINFKIEMKKRKNMMFLGLVGDDSKYIFADINCDGTTNNSNTLYYSELMDIIQKPTEYFPDNEFVTEDTYLPYVIIADRTFPLLKHLLVPYDSNNQLDCYAQIFNLRLNAAKIAADKAFAMLTQRFPILKSMHILTAEKVRLIVQTCCILHNFFIENNDWNIEINENKKAESNLFARKQIDLETSLNEDRMALDIRNEFASYLAFEGSIVNA